jgi:hypothetical protein
MIEGGKQAVSRALCHGTSSFPKDLGPIKILILCNSLSKKYQFSKASF